MTKERHRLAIIKQKLIKVIKLQEKYVSLQQF